MRPSALPPSDPARREFLRTSLAGSAILLAAAVLPSGCARDEEAPRGLLVLEPGEYLTMAAVAARLIPKGGIFAAGAANVDAARRIDRILSRLGSDTQRRVARALRFFDAAPLFSWRLRSFRRLSGAERDRVLQAWHSSRRALRSQVFDAFKSLTMLAFYESRAGRRALGIAEDPCRARASAGARRVASARGGSRP